MIRPFLSVLTVALIFAACGDDSDDSKNSGTGGTSATDAGPEAGPDADSDVAPDTQAGGTVGATCSSDADCAQGLSCWRDDGNETRFPSHGMCTVSCAADATICTKLSPAAVCMQLVSGDPDAKRCVEQCSLHSPSFTSLSAGMPTGKCHGRNDMACTPSNTGGGCVPACNDDSACTTGKCSVKTGFCQSGQVEPWTDKMGQAVSSNFDCPAGVVVSGGVTVCVPSCTLGVVPSCNWKGTNADATAACVFGQSPFGQGDQGGCLALCNCDGDCSPPLKCNTLPAFASQATGSKGYCWMGQSGLPCADAGDDAGGDGAADATADAVAD